MINARRAILTLSAHRSDDACHAVFGVGDPAFGVPHAHAAIGAFALLPLPHQRRCRRHFLIVNRNEIEPRQKLFVAVGEQLVPCICAGTRAADEDVRAAGSRFHDALCHALIKLTIARQIGAPAGNRNAFPRLVPQFHGVDGAARPAVFTDHLCHPFLKVVIVFGQPRGVEFGVLHHAVGIEPRTPATERLRLVVNRPAADGQHHRDVVVGGPFEMLLQFVERILKIAVVARRVADAHARPAHAETPESLRHRLAHFERPRQIERVSRLEHFAGVRFRHAHQRRAKSATGVAEIENRGIAAEFVRQNRRGVERRAAFGRHFDFNRHAADNAFARDMRHPHVAGLDARVVGNRFERAFQTQRIGAGIVDDESQLGLFARPKRVRADAGRRLRDGEILNFLLGLEAERLSEAGHFVACDHLCAQRRGGHDEARDCRQSFVGKHELPFDCDYGDCVLPRVFSASPVRRKIVHSSISTAPTLL